MKPTWPSIARALFRALIILSLALLFFVPLYWMILTALKSKSEALRLPPSFWLSSAHWENFARAFSAFPFMRFLANSLIVSIAILACQTFTVIPAAYAFARFKFKGSSLFFAITLASVMMPAQLVFLPVFILMTKLGLINHYPSLILPSAASAFGIFMLRQTFRQIPEELIEAARLDKSSELKTLFFVILPIARPSLAALGLLTFISSWNDYFWPLVLTTNDRVRTLPLGIASLKLLESGVSIPYQVVMAGNLLLILPILIVFTVARRHIIKAFTYMGEK